jgi:hypothetical protein
VARHVAVDQAIAAAAGEAADPVRMVQLRVTIGTTGRPAAVLLPADATESEVSQLAGWLLTTVAKAARTGEEQRKRSGIIVARGRVPTPLARA